MLRRGQLSRIRGSKPQSTGGMAPMFGYHWWTEQAPFFFSLKVKYRTKWAIYAIEKPVKLLEGKVLDVFFRFAVCHIGIHWCFLTSENVEQTAASLCNLWITCTYIHTHTYIYIYTCMYSCLSVWMSLMPAYAKVYHSSVSEATCGTWDYDLCRNETDCPGLSGPWSLRSKGLGPVGHMAMAILQLLRYLQWNGEMDLPELVLCGQVAGLRFWGSFRELEWLAFDGLVDALGHQSLGLNMFRFLKICFRFEHNNCTNRCLAQMISEESWVIAWMRRSQPRVDDRSEPHLSATRHHGLWLKPRNQRIDVVPSKH